MANELSTIESTLVKLDDALNQFSISAPDVKHRLAQTFKMSMMANQIRSALTDEIMATVFLPLKNTSLGFKTDEATRSRPYTVAEIRDALVDGILRGLLPINNEMNIIGGNLYSAKNGVKRLARDRVTKLVMMPSIPRMASGGALVDYTATFELDGKPMKLERKGESAFPIRVNNGQGADAILGKAERKMYNFILETISGMSFEDSDMDDSPADAATVTVDLTHVQPAELAAPQTKAEELTDAMKQALNKQAVITAKANNKKKAAITPPPAEAAPEPAAPAATEPPPAETPDELPEAERALLEKAYAALRVAPYKCSPTTPMLVGGKVSHPNLTADGVLKPAPAPVAAPGVPKTGTPVDPNKPKHVGFVKNPNTGVMEKWAPKGTELGKQAEAEKVAMQLPVAAPTATRKEPLQASEATGDTGVVETIDSLVVAKRRPKLKPEDIQAYVITDDHNTQYITVDDKLAKKCRTFEEKKIKARLQFHIVNNDYMLLDADEVPPEPAAETEPPWSDSLDNTDEQPPAQ